MAELTEYFSKAHQKTLTPEVYRKSTSNYFYLKLVRTIETYLSIV